MSVRDYVESLNQIFFGPGCADPIVAEVIGEEIARLESAGVACWDPSGRELLFNTWQS
jgi:hypothetical protein